MIGLSDPLFEINFISLWRRFLTRYMKIEYIMKNKSAI